MAPTELFRNAKTRTAWDIPKQSSIARDMQRAVDGQHQQLGRGRMPHGGRLPARLRHADVDLAQRRPRGGGGGGVESDDVGGAVPAEEGLVEAPDAGVAGEDQVHRAPREAAAQRGLRGPRQEGARDGRPPAVEEDLYCHFEMPRGMTTMPSGSM